MRRFEAEFNNYHHPIADALALRLSDKSISRQCTPSHFVSSEASFSRILRFQAPPEQPVSRTRQTATFVPLAERRHPGAAAATTANSNRPSRARRTWRVLVARDFPQRRAVRGPDRVQVVCQTRSLRGSSARYCAHCATAQWASGGQKSFPRLGEGRPRRSALNSNPPMSPH